MADLFKIRKKEPSEKKNTSLQRSTDIFLCLTNLSMEWNMFCFVGSFVSPSEKEKYWDDMHKKMAQSIVDSIKSLKGCWVKLGQFLSTKSGFLPPYYLDALAQLQDFMPSSDFTEIIETLEEDLGYMDDIYSNFDSIPIASASIAQVHKAKLVDGSPVAVKVQHKSSEQNLLNDIEILKMITRMMHAAGVYTDIRDYFDEYSVYITKELDFTIEANNIELSQLDAIKSKTPVRIPRLYKEHCSRRVITMEFYTLNKFTDKEFLRRHNVNLPQVLYDIHDFAFFQIMNCGRFHSDPHPGNLQLQYDPKDKKIYPVFLDWGFTTHINDVERVGVSRLYKCVYTYDPIGIISAMLETGFTTLDTFPYRYDSLFDAFINILLASHKLSFECVYDETSDLRDDLTKIRDMQAKIQKLIQDFIFMYFKKAPNFVPLSFKVLSEYQSLSKSLSSFMPFLHIIYKNASFALYSVYGSPLNYYYSRLCLPVLQNKLNSVKYKLNHARRGRAISEESYLGKLRKLSFYGMLELLSNESMKRNKYFRLFSELVFHDCKNLLESRLADLLRYLDQDGSNMIGCQVGVIHNGAIEVELSFGNIDKYELRPISNESLFPLFNMSCGLLTVAVLHLASIGKLSLDDRVHIYWPEFKPNKECITIRDVLEHRCGVIYTDYPFFDICTSREMMCKCVEGAHFFYHHRGADYSIIFYGFILSEIITRVTNVPTEEFVLMLASMIGIDSANLLFPNPAPTSVKCEATEDSDKSEDESNAEANDAAYDITKNLNELFGESVSVFHQQLPLMNIFNINQISRPRRGRTSEGSESDSGYSDSSDSVQITSGDGLRRSARSRDKRAGSKRGPKSDSDDGRRKFDSAQKIKIVSLDDNCPDSAFRDVELDIEEFRKKLSFQSTVIDIPVDDHGQADSSYFCACYKYDKDFPDDELKRCYVPTKYCPVPNRLVKIFRGKSEDCVFPGYSKFLDPGDDELPHGNYDPEYCAPILKRFVIDKDSDEYLSYKIRESIRKTFSSLYDSEEERAAALGLLSEGDEADSNFTSSPRRPGIDSIGKMGRLVKSRDKVCLNENSLVKLEGFTFNDLVRFKCNMIDPMIVNYSRFFLNSVPYLNARCNALSLSLFYYSVLSGALVSSNIMDEVMRKNTYDPSILKRFFIGIFQARFSLGFQKFAFLDRENRLCEGFGHSDISGSVVVGIPSQNLAITVFVSHYTRQYVFIKIFDFILEHYGLKLIDYKVTDPNYYRVLALL